MKISCHRPILLILPLMGLALGPSALAAGVLRVDGKGCPSIADHQRFVDELVSGNIDYSYPPICIDLPTGMTVSDPIESKMDRFGSETTEFILVEVAGEGRYWTIASWVESASSEAEPLAPEAQSAPAEDTATADESVAAPADETAAAPDQQSEPALAGEASTLPSDETGPATPKIEPASSETTGSLEPSPAAVNASKVWFAQELMVHFGDSIPFHGTKLAFDRLACLPTDITTFKVTAKVSAAGLSVGGSLDLSALPARLGVGEEGQESGYKVLLQAYLFNPKGRLIWMQQGSPQDDASVSAEGGSVAFELKRRFRGSLTGHTLLVVAAGDPMSSDASGPPVILGVKKLML